MVVSIITQHIFKYPVDMVLQMYIKRNKSIQDGYVINVGDIECKTENGMTCTKHTLSFWNFIPSVFRLVNILKTESIIMEEECWNDLEGKRFWIRTRNITWEDDAVIAQCAFICAHKQNPYWSYWDQNTVIDFKAFGKLGLIIELYLKRFFQGRIKYNITEMESLMADK